MRSLALSKEIQSHSDQGTAYGGYRTVGLGTVLHAEIQYKRLDHRRDMLEGKRCGIRERGHNFEIHQRQ